ncbi:sulfatase-like hydrolase/transferase [Chitinophaga agrisoli]|uniref:Sulfatase-like hydrolase/transferase n=1 Tax=Chitinophaga agrisoli TaxID=2607653 RepID=A0A5B2VRZ6_9BACT|nr:alkaline phosphatase family protein [Chitinophaga agrisoli]KAA2241795.1 sulfatase-like hydrolase/transferase [Chitinophaga agrisoli]
MKYFWKNIPQYIRFVLVQACYLFLLTAFFRLVFYLFFFKTTITDTALIRKAWYLGLKFDLRLTLIMIIPLGLLVVITRNRFFTSGLLRRINFVYLFLVYLVLTVLYVLDLGHYAYLGLRLDPSITRFMASGERADNMRMVWQSYPVVRGVIGIGLFLFLLYRLQVYTYRRLALQPAATVKGWRYAGWVTALVILFGAGIYGNFAYFPLRWSQAMFTRDNGITSLALNPILYFTDNFSTKGDTYDIQKTREYYPYMAQYLRVDTPDAQLLNYERSYPGVDRPRSNIVLVMLESTGAAVTSMFNNPMQATPNMQMLADSGILFRNFYVPAVSTAKTVYGVTTGLPDITQVKTASRHPQMVDQRIIMDQFNGYEKYYLLGGNTNWANIRAVFTNNVDSIKIYEEGYFKAAKADVWGVSDYDLVTEASEIFKNAHQRKQPFVAFLQTADNHAPYTTTKGAGDFRKLTEQEIDMNKFKEAGFVTIDQFNALRYLDYNLGHLIRLAKEGGYLDNTIFVFFGDHNCILNPYHFMPYPEYELGSGGEHVPCIIYAPGRLKPQEVTRAGSLLDVYPTVANLAGVPHKNYTLGIDLLDTTYSNRYAFISYMKNLQWCTAVIGDQYMYELNTRSGKTALYDLKGDALKDVQQEHADTARALNNLTHGFYESTRYLMFNNKKGLSAMSATHLSKR